MKEKRSVAPGGYSSPDGLEGVQLMEFAKSLRKAQGERLREARKKADLTIEQLAQLSAMHFNTIGRIERGESEMDIDQLLVISHVLKMDPALFQPIQASTLKEDEFSVVDVLDVQVSAGGGAINGDSQAVSRFAFQRKWLKQIGVKPVNAKVIRARGDSMADKINDGDVLLVDTSVTQIERDGVYVIERDGHDYVKVLQRDFATGGVQIISYNPSYKPQLLTPEQAADLRISGRVVWHGGEL